MHRILNYSVQDRVAKATEVTAFCLVSWWRLGLTSRLINHLLACRPDSRGDGAATEDSEIIINVQFYDEILCFSAYRVSIAVKRRSLDLPQCGLLADNRQR